MRDNPVILFWAGGRAHCFTVDWRLWPEIPRVIAALRWFRLPIPVRVGVTRAADDAGHLYKRDDGKLVVRLQWKEDRTTVAHELAHLRFWEHGKQHTRLSVRILDYWASKGL